MDTMNPDPAVLPTVPPRTTPPLEEQNRTNVRAEYVDSRDHRALADFGSRFADDNDKARGAIVRLLRVVLAAAVGTLRGAEVLGPQSEDALSAIYENPLVWTHENILVGHPLTLQSLIAELTETKASRVRAVTSLLIAATRVCHAIQEDARGRVSHNTGRTLVSPALDAFIVEAAAVLGERVLVCIRTAIPWWHFPNETRERFEKPAPRLGRHGDGSLNLKGPSHSFPMLAAALNVGISDERIAGAMLALADVAEQRARKPLSSRAASSLASARERLVPDASKRDVDALFNIMCEIENVLLPKKRVLDEEAYEAASNKLTPLWLPVLARAFPEVVDLMAEHRDFAIKHKLELAYGHDPRATWERFVEISAGAIDDAHSIDLERAA